MKKNSPSELASAIVSRATSKTNRRTITWYDRISDFDRSVVNSVVEKCLRQPHTEWYVVADSLIDTLKLPAKRERVKIMLQELAKQKIAKGR